jgi:4-hydroxysphinganine ceramide fatty acyl 2-hydroxylase
MLVDYKIGCLGTTDAEDTEEVEMNRVVTQLTQPPKGYYTVDKEDPAQPFIDLHKPLFYQMWTCNWSKAYYLDQIHRARHLPEPARLFASDWIEPLSRTPWWIIPLLWVPVTLWYLKSNMDQFGTTNALLWLMVGLGVWTALEYSLHRFLFHIDKWLPDHPKALALHFLLHGVHHYLPMDRLRLVFPPTLFIMVATPVHALFHAVLPRMVASGVWPGVMVGYICYDMIHYYVHHARPLTAYLRDAKTYHLAHHYKNPNLGFGITNKWWDRVFGTELLL